jgi:DnaA family protein
VSQQLALNIRLREGATFTAYYPGPNEAAVNAIEALADEHSNIQQAYLWGATATGKSHLLQAVCHRMSQLGRSCIYVPLAQFNAADAGALEDLWYIWGVCIDDVDAIAGRPAWERALFNLINDVRGARHRLVLASKGNPVGMTLTLPDLQSRLLWGPVFHLKALDDEAKLAALKARARQCGLALKSEAARFLLNNCRRDLGSLLAALSRLDEASLAAQRRVTIPFIKSVLGL